MHDVVDGAPGAVETFDQIAEGLRTLRAEAGEVAYAEIASRIAERRERRGVPHAAARIARSTVYDAFRAGRARLNPALVGEIVAALGAGDDEAAHWEARCRSARVGGVPASAPPAEHRSPVATPLAPTTARARAVRFLLVSTVILGCVGVNLTGNLVVAGLGLPLYADMIGTAVAAMCVGPWPGVAVALATNVLAAPTNTINALPFAMVNVVGALLWGYGVRRFGLGRSLPRYFVLNLIVALGCTATAVPILVLMFQGAAGHASDAFARTLMGLGELPLAAVFSSNLLNSVADKTIAGFVALVALSVLARWREPGQDVIWARPSREASFSLAPSEDAAQPWSPQTRHQIV